MNRDYARGPQLSRNTSNNVGWGTKIKGAIQVTHGLGEAIRGTLGASDFGGPQNSSYTPSGQIAHRGRQEIAEGLARMRGTAAQLPSAPIYDRRHSYPTHQYEQRAGPMASVLRRRSRSASTQMRRENPPTASEPFEKFYEHPHAVPQTRPDDSGFAGIGAGVDPATRKELGGGIVPAFLIQPPAQLPSSRYPPQPSHGNFHPNQGHGGYIQTQYQNPSSLAGVPPMTSPTTLRSSIISAPPAGDRPNNTDLLSVPSQHPGHSSSSASVPSQQPSPSPLRSSFLGGNKARKGKGKEKEKEPHNKLRRRRRRSFFGRRVVTRPATPDRDEALRAPQEFTRSAPATPPRPAHQHESTLEHAGYDVLSYDAKDVYPSWPAEGEIRRQQTTRFEPVRGR
ncbi:hypothetical protein R3P38DRAFT_3188689 [Favolaschia claudopus]|uniref:Uncharacterized protein n=1 Tax=Favolaschia claudopus TaxID=2862362 RepID=A0AAW0BWZ4_9AGAR